MLEQVRIPEAAQRARPLSAPTVRRHAPARDDRHGAVVQAALLIADEPTTALDVTIQAQILDADPPAAAEMHMAVIFITHDMGVVAEVADRVVVMYRGEEVEDGAAEQRLRRAASSLHARPARGRADAGRDAGHRRARVRCSARGAAAAGGTRLAPHRRAAPPRRHRAAACAD